MKLHHIRDLVAVAERGSLRSASRHLNMTQPAITRSIRELEHELGVVLFERRANGVVMTAMGEAFFRRAKGVQTELQRARDEIEQLKGAVEGEVSIGLSTASLIALLPRVVEAFHRRFPDVRLKVLEGLLPTLEPMLQDGTLDFFVGPVADGAAPPECVLEPLFANSLIIVARRGHCLGSAGSLAELTSARWVISSVTIDGEAQLASLYAAHDLPKPRVAAQANTALSTITLVASSDLLALLPKQWLDFVARSAAVQRIAVTELLPTAPICCLRRARLPLTPAAEHLCDLFKRAAGAHGGPPPRAASQAPSNEPDVTLVS